VIIPINVALGIHDYIEVPLNVSLDDVIDRIYESKNISGSSGKGSIVKVRAVTLTELLNMINVEPDVLKLDCEGCEYDVIKDPSIQLFSELGIECHSQITDKNCKVFIDELRRKGFKCSIIKHFRDRVIIHCVKHC